MPCCLFYCHLAFLLSSPLLRKPKRDNLLKRLQIELWNNCQYGLNTGIYCIFVKRSEKEGKKQVLQQLFAECCSLVSSLSFKKMSLKGGGNNGEATTWKRQGGREGENLKWKYKNYKTAISTPQILAVFSVSIWQHSPPLGKLRQRGSDNLEATTCDPYWLLYINIPFLMEIQKH